MSFNLSFQAVEFSNPRKVQVSALFMVLYILFPIELVAQKSIPLYTHPIPGSETWDWSEKEYFPFPGLPILYNVVEPALVHYPAPLEKATGTAIIVAPGGGFHFLAIGHEGRDVASWLNALGISVFVLKYRVARSYTDDPLEEVAPLMSDRQKFDSLNLPIVELAKNDGVQAMRYVIENAATLEINPSLIGFMGFSAGGTVTLSVALSAEEKEKPNFIAPIYLYADAVLGSTMPQGEMPAFVAVAADDGLGLASHSVGVYERWINAKQAVELHVYESGDHGFGMRKQGKRSDFWTVDFELWLKSRKLIPD
ncbi:MAG: alpha/beta hydrolase [Algoriphagus sp.]|nr:alpha/beta hydrolase [Algoriphagus sp.]